MRGFVAVLFAADTVNTVLSLVFLYKYLITNFGSLEYASRSNDEFATDPIMVSFIGFMTQLFFAWRVWKLSNNRFSWLVPVLIVGIGFLSFLAAIGSTVGVVIVREFARFQTFQVAVIIWLAGTAIADAIITVSLIITLHKARTGFSQTDDIITKLIRGTLQTGLLTASFAIIDLLREFGRCMSLCTPTKLTTLTFHPAVFLASSTTLHLIFNLPLAKLYVNSLLSTLNARAFTSNARYTMHSSALRGMGGVTNQQLKMAESGGAIQSQGSAKGFNPVSSNSEVATVNDNGARKGMFKSGASNRRDDNGIHILTIEERFESDIPQLGANPLPYTTRGMRTPGESRKSSESSIEEDRFEEALAGNMRSEGSLPLTALNNGRGRAPSTSSPPRVASLQKANHPYNQY